MTITTHRARIATPGLGHRRASFIAAALATLACTGALAQATAPAPAASAPAPTTRGADPLALPPSQTPDFVLRELQLPKLSKVSEAELDALVLPYLRQTLDAARRRQIAETLRALLESRGLVLAGVAVRTVDAAQGIARVVVIEPRVGRIDVPPVDDAPISEAHVLGLLAGTGITPQGLLDLDRLDEAMFMLNDLPGVSVRANLQPSGDDGVFDLALERKARKAYDAAVDADNHGSRFSGKVRVGAFGRWNNPSRSGDNLDARVLGSADGGLLVGRLAYERPLGATPWRGSLALSHITYELGAELAALKPTGKADIVELAVTRPLIRSRERNLLARLGIDMKKARDEFDLDNTRVGKTIRNISGGLSYEARDRIGGGGYSGGSATLQIGQLRFDNALGNTLDQALGERATRGRFAKLSLQGSRLQALAPDWTAYAGLTVQWADKNLDSSEKFTLGGPQGVRAYPSGDTAGDRGAILTAELRRAFGTDWSVFGLVDAGTATLQVQPQPGAANSRSLMGWGLGAYFNDPKWFTLRATLAFRGSQAPQSESGSGRERFFMQVQRAF